MIGKSRYPFARYLFAALLSMGSPLSAGCDIMSEPASGAPLLPTIRLAAAGAGMRRSKNRPTKRRLKPNRLHVGRRVRRKHRRAA